LCLSLSPNPAAASSPCAHQQPRRLLEGASSSLPLLPRTLTIYAAAVGSLVLSSTLTLIGLAVLIRTSPPRAMLCFSVTVSSPGPPSVRPLCPDPVLRPSIALWQMVLPKRHGCASFYKSSMLLCAVPRWSIVTTSAQSTCPQTQCNISDQTH